MADKIPKATYSAFCRKYGNHSTPAVGHHNWNEEALSEMVTDLEDPWQDLAMSLQDLQLELVQSVETVTNAAIDMFGESHALRVLLRRHGR